MDSSIAAFAAFFAAADLGADAIVCELSNSLQESRDSERAGQHDCVTVGY
jgi:hypothetical protein